jgi:hypothetical protein
MGVIEPTSWGDGVAAEMRAHYEANREGWWDRWRKPWRYSADNLMLGLYIIAGTSEHERDKIEAAHRSSLEASARGGQ